MTMTEEQSAGYLGPKQGAIAAMQYDATSREFSLETYLGSLPRGRFLTMWASSGSACIAFTDGSGTAISDTQYTAGDVGCAFAITSGQIVRCIPQGSHITIKGSGAGTFRMYYSSM